MSLLCYTLCLFLCLCGANEGHPLFAQQVPPAPFPFGEPEDVVTIRADSQEKIGPTYRLNGHVEVTFRQMRLRAEQATYDDSRGDVVAHGQVVFDDPQSHLEAREAHYHIHTGQGWFTDVVGYVRTEPPRGRLLLASPTPFRVQARKLERVNENTYIAHGARVTSCAANEFGWWVSARRATLEAGDRVSTRHSVLGLGAVPIFYLPYLIASIAPRPRRSGFLLPQIGNSSQKGFFLAQGFYWAINRSADLTLGLQNYTIRGLGAQADFRARPSADSRVEAHYFRVNDRGSGPQRRSRAPGASLRLTGEGANLFHGFRGVVDVDHISSLAFRLAFTDNFSQAVTSEVRSLGFLSKNFGAYNFNALLSRYQNFLSAEQVPGNSVILRRTPSFSFSGIERQVGSSPFYFAFDSSLEGMARTEPGFETPVLVQRSDIFPRLTLRSQPFWGVHLTPRFGVRATRYSSSRSPDRGGLTRWLGDFSVDLRPPALEKSFGRKFLGYQVKHVIEPEIRYQLVQARDPERIQDVIRFDQLDILTETNEIEYSLTQRLFFRQDIQQQEKPPAREILSWRLSQKYFFDPTLGGALRARERIVFEPTASLTGFAFATGRHLSPLVSVLRFAPFSNYDTELRTDISPSGGGVLNAGITSHLRHPPFFLSLTEYFINRTSVLSTRLLTPEAISRLRSFNLLRAVVGFGSANRRGLSGAFGLDYNFAQEVAHQTVSQVSYNFGCFAVDFEYRRFALGPFRREHQFRVAVSLANVGTFGNLKPQEHLY